MKKITQPSLFMFATSVTGMLLGEPVIGATIDSREYKLMLATDHFAGTNPAVDDYWTTRLIPLIDETLGRKSEGDSRAERRFELKEQRLVRFFDTSDCQLQQNGYVFRERAEAPGGVQEAKSREGTLKFRSRDEITANEARLENESEFKSKFEEDISPGKVQFARSATIEEIDDNKKINKIDDVFDLFGKMDGPLGRLDEDLPLRLVSEFTAFERAYKGAEVELGEDLDAKFTLTLWYEHASEQFDEPVIAELSFSYDVDEELDPAVPRRAEELFAALQSPDFFFEPTSETKTAFAYKFGDFCP